MKSSLCQFLSCINNSWSSRIQKDSTHTWATISGCCNSHISFLTPGSSPWVSDDEIFFSTFLTVSYGCDGMVEFVTTNSWVENTRLISLPMVAFCINTNASWLDGNWSFQLRDALFRNSVVSRNFDDAFILFNSASLSLANVLVVCLR